jgi:uncharacterized DUF497 family protein
MDGIRFECDGAKEKANLTKHGISFEEVRTVFMMSMPFNTLTLTIRSKKIALSCSG